MDPVKFRVTEISRYEARSGVRAKVSLQVVHGSQAPPWPVVGQIILDLEQPGYFDIGEEHLVTFEPVE